jgi:peptidoglycan/xylan/chitin deacetylase (PgdA/CDA1 family)
MNKTEMKKITNLLKPFSKITNSVKCDKFQRVILTYHGISNHSSFNCVAKDLFRDQIAWLKENYIVVPLFELIKNIGSRNTKKAHMASLTFDDGYVNFCEHAVPILEEYGCHATAFIPSGKVGCHNDWDEGEKGFQKMPIMSYQQLRELPEEIVEIGSHGISHIALGKLASHEVQREIFESRSEIEQKIGRRVRFFSYPFGSYPFQYRAESNQNIKLLLSAYAGACTIWWGRFNEQKDIYALRRIGIWESDSFEDFLDKMRGYYDWLAAKEIFCKFFNILTY